VILLTHHPVNWLAENEYEDYTTLMERYGIIHLHGHIHRTKIHKLFSIAGSSYISVGTGSLYGEKGLGDINTYHIITLDFKKEEVHIWARRWIPERGCWGLYDNDINNTFPFPGKHH
jgi:hypothetical protein